MNHPKDTLTPAELDQLTRQRRVLVHNRLATHVSIGEDLLTVLDSPLRNTITELLAALATLAVHTDPNQSPSWDPTRNPNKGDRIPRFDTVWAERKLEQIDRILYGLAGNIQTWANRPHDPNKPLLCPNCGRKPSQDDLHCRWCGTGGMQKLRDVIQECEWCGNTFVPMRSDARYCSPAHRLAAHRRRETDETDNPKTSIPHS